MTQSIRITWPARPLWPNWTGKLRLKIAAKKGARDSAFYLAKSVHMSAPAEGPIPVLITFYPPDKRRRDRDNMLAAFKHQLDGIALAMKVDDSRFVPTIAVGEGTGGFVEVVVG